VVSLDGITRSPHRCEDRTQRVSNPTRRGFSATARPLCHSPQISLVLLTRARP